MNLNLSDLSLPFPAQDIEWRVSRAGTSPRGIYCRVLCYITARGVQERLDDVCGPENWRVEAPHIISVNGKNAFSVGISIRIGDDWITKWDVSDPTNIEPAKGGFSGAMKRAGAQWGIGRYLYHLDEAFAEVSEKDPGVRGWHYAKLPEKSGGSVYWWKPPRLPAWALPKERDESEIKAAELNDLKIKWKNKFAADVKNRADLVEGFNRFVTSIVGEFPVADHQLWTRDAMDKCLERIEATEDPNGVSADVPFDSE